jgi:hypothetical protein
MGVAPAQHKRGTSSWPKTQDLDSEATCRSRCHHSCRQHCACNYNTRTNCLGNTMTAALLYMPVSRKMTSCAVAVPLVVC